MQKLGRDVSDGYDIWQLGACCNRRRLETEAEPILVHNICLIIFLVLTCSCELILPVHLIKSMPCTMLFYPYILSNQCHVACYSENRLVSGVTSYLRNRNDRANI